MRLKNITDVDSVNLRIPPANTTEPLQFSFNDTVQSILSRLVESRQLPPNIKYGLYYRQLGIWLDPSKTLTTYEINTEVQSPIDSTIYLFRLQ